MKSIKKRFLLQGMKFNHLTAIEASGKDKHNNLFWIWKCDCGNEKEIRACNVTNGGTKSCGCSFKNKATIAMKNSLIKHAHSSGGNVTPEYQAYQAMKSRIKNKNRKDFIHYGGRGIKICFEWELSFENFLKDMGPRPSQKHSLDRIDVNGNYEPDNCRWATTQQQVENRREENRPKFKKIKLPK